MKSKAVSRGTQVHPEFFFLGGGRRGDPEAILYNWMFAFKNHVMKIMSKSHSWCLVRVQGKLKPKKKKKNLYICKFLFYFSLFQFSAMGRDGSVSIRLATCWMVCGLKPSGGWDFPYQSRPAVGPTQPPIQWVPGLFARGKVAREWHWAPTPNQHQG